MDKNEEEPTKKCFCARCFFPIEPADKVDIEGQNFHRFCSTCCICRTIPSSVKMFYGHVFCNECFKTYVQSRFKGETPCVQANSWWMKWAPGMKPPSNDSEGPKNAAENQPEESQKRCICARCLQTVDEKNKIDIGEQSFHTQCAKCYFCHCIPTTSPKIYYGQVFCDECFQKHVLNRSKDNSSEFFKNCLEQWQNNAQFAENMREFVNGGKENTSCFSTAQSQQPSFCRCGAGPQEGFHGTELKKSATPATVSIGGEESFGTWDLSFEHRTEVSDIPESCNTTEETDLCNSNVFAAEKIEKLTKYLHEIDEYELDKCTKKWKNFEFDKASSGSVTEQFLCGWTDLQDPKTRGVQLDCPKCLWQCGPIYVNSEYLQKNVFCGDVSVE